MIKEAQDDLRVLTLSHEAIDKMTEGLTADQWLFRPNGTWNNIAAILSHIARVERKFFAAVAGERVDVDTRAPFQQSEWDLSAIKTEWRETIPYAQSALEKVTDESLAEAGLTLGQNALNKREVILYALAHTAHHRGQIPLVKKFL